MNTQRPINETYDTGHNAQNDEQHDGDQEDRDPTTEEIISDLYERHEDLARRLETLEQGQDHTRRSSRQSLSTLAGARHFTFDVRADGSATLQYFPPQSRETTGFDQARAGRGGVELGLGRKRDRSESSVDDGDDGDGDRKRKAHKGGEGSTGKHGDAAKKDGRRKAANYSAISAARTRGVGSHPVQAQPNSAFGMDNSKQTTEQVLSGLSDVQPPSTDKQATTARKPDGPAPAKRYEPFTKDPNPAAKARMAAEVQGRSNSEAPLSPKTKPKDLPPSLQPTNKRGKDTWDWAPEGYKPRDAVDVAERPEKNPSAIMPLGPDGKRQRRATVAKQVGSDAPTVPPTPKNGNATKKVLRSSVASTVNGGKVNAGQGSRQMSKLTQKTTRPTSKSMQSAQAPAPEASAAGRGLKTSEGQDKQGQRKPSTQQPRRATGVEPPRQTSHSQRNHPETSKSAPKGSAKPLPTAREPSEASEFDESDIIVPPPRGKPSTSKPVGDARCRKTAPSGGRPSSTMEAPIPPSSRESSLSSVPSLSDEDEVRERLQPPSDRSTSTPLNPHEEGEDLDFISRNGRPRPRASDSPNTRAQLAYDYDQDAEVEEKQQSSPDQRIKGKKRASLDAT